MEPKNNNYRFYAKIAVILLVLGLLMAVMRYYVNWMWFESLGFDSIFVTTLLSKVFLYVIIFIVAFLFIWLNLRLTKRSGDEPEEAAEEAVYDEEGNVVYMMRRGGNPFADFLTGKVGKWVFIGAALLGAIFVSSVAGDNWLTVQQYFNSVAFGTTDPIFNKDISFYFFDLSFYQFVYGLLMLLVILTLTVCAAVYLLNTGGQNFLNNWREFSFSKMHLAILLAIILAVKAWGYRLSMYSILFSTDSIIFGAGYTDVHARLLAYKVLMVVALIAAVLILVNIFIRHFNWIVYCFAAWVVIALGLGTFYPMVIQSLVVKPNEANREKPYIEHAIEYTRLAYGLDQVDDKEFKLDYSLTMDDIQSNRPTIDNIRLWDWQPLKDTYKSVQELRAYYYFHDVDIDRYYIDGAYRQVMLSAREMEDMSRLPNWDEQAKTWVNQRLMYTHGYGLVVSPVTEVEQEGFPHYIIKDVPPVFETDLTVSRPEIYFGERTDSWVMVNTNQEEFDYPMGTSNVFTTYEGDKGLKVKSFTRRLILAWHLRDFNMIFSSDINNNSQLLMNRNIMDRIQTIAPWLAYDRDPYIVINDDGTLFWMLDAYTFTNKFPYSQPYNNIANSNYIRNSVKVTCNAYTGEVTFYIADDQDPIVKTFQAIFPDAFHPLEEMPDGLKAHIRYPVDMFTIQANIWANFHMDDPSVFYNKEDTWVIPNEIVGSKEQTMEPYYIITHLSGEETEEYILMIPYIPNGRPNMTAWMCARMDGDNYGKILIYSFPKQETVYGPMQIESRINQNTEISQQLTLWNQSGTSTYRGNLLVIPIEDTILYVEPLYLQATNSALPELKRVIASYHNTVVMEETLEKALIAIFGPASSTDSPSSGNSGESTETPGTSTGTTEATVASLAAQAQSAFDNAEQAAQNGDWTNYGRYLDQLKAILAQLNQVTAQ